MDWKYENGRIYSVDDDGQLLAEATFIFKNSQTAEIDHTYVNPTLRGQGVAGRMMEAVTAHFKENGLKACATCPYAAAWLEKHPDACDVVSDAAPSAGGEA